MTDLPGTSPPVRTPSRVPAVVFFCLVFLPFWTGCADDSASTAVELQPPGQVPVSEDPAVAEIVALTRDFRTRVLAAGLDGDDVRRLSRSGDPHALSHRVGYSPEDMAARDARLGAAVDDLVARHPEARESATACAPCGDEGFEAWAAWLDSEPNFEPARVVFLCEIVPLVLDILNCIDTTPFLSDAMFACVDAALCRNCTGC